jgi:hypothetical protein
MKNVKEFHVGKIEGSSDFSLMFIPEDDSKEISFRVSRDLALNIIESLFLARDTFGVYRPKDVH